jgi:large subunit ribosomal protein L24
MRRTSNLVPKLHIKKGDTVRVLSGDDRGQTGRVIEVMPKESMAIVEGLNMITKHVKPNQATPNGDRVKREAPIRACKLQLIEPKTGKPTRIGRVQVEGKGWVRVSKKTGNQII